MDRKLLVESLSNLLGVKAKYLRTPTYAYELKTEDETYTVDRLGKIKNSSGEYLELEDVINAQVSRLNEEPRGVEEAIADEELSVFEYDISIKGYAYEKIINIVNMFYSKQNILIKSLDLQSKFVEKNFVRYLNEVTLNEKDELKDFIKAYSTDGYPGLAFDFENEKLKIKLSVLNLTDEKAQAMKDLFKLIGKKAKELKFAYYKKAQEENEKYALRTWLIRMGMNGKEYKESRKVLLDNLSGSAAFR